MWTLKTLLPAAALATLIAGPAFAHAHLEAAVPADGSTVSTVSDITVTFSEGVDLAFTGITLKGPGDATVKTGTAHAAGNDQTVAVPVTGPLKPGHYTVEWHALSTDGHKSKGQFSFTVAP